MEFDSRILKVQDFLDDGVVSDRIVTLETPKDFSFRSGQFVMIAHESVKNKFDAKQLRWGSMSISSSPLQKGSIELVVSVGNPGGITHFVGTTARHGDHLQVRGPFGVFGIKDAFDEIVFVATGTGIAPLMSMIRSLLEDGEKKPIRLFFGFKKPSKFLYESELAELKKRHSNFSVEIICSREPTPKTGKMGHVQELLERQKWIPAKNVHFFICGTPQAVPQIVELIRSKGFPAERIHFEQW